jgi:hypothetical protein
LGSHRRIREGLEDAFDTAGGRLPDSKVKIRGPALAGLSEELKDIDLAHEWDCPL